MYGIREGMEGIKSYGGRGMGGDIGGSVLENGVRRVAGGAGSLGDAERDAEGFGGMEEGGDGDRERV